MRYGKLLVFLVPLLALAACDDDGISGPQSRGPTAALRFINLNVDTGTVDFKFVDKVETMPTFMGVPFRGSSGVYQGVSSGTRPARIFPTSTNLVMTSTMLVDTTVNLVTDTRYTYLYAGRARNNQARLMVFEDPPVLPTPAAGAIAIKALHGAVGTGAVDIYVVPVDTTTSPTPANFQTAAVTVIQNVGYLTQTAYREVPVRPAAGPRFYRFVVTAAGSPTPLFAATPNLPGAAAPAGASYGPQPGVRIAGSVLTVVVAPGTDAGTRESATANQSPTVLLLVDKPLNPPPPAS